jgi:uncharacterized BrkB/YihY/UPF0761 family membrane protein
MQNFTEWKKVTIRHWERRRIGYNIMLIPPALFGYLLPARISAGVGDERQLTFVSVLGLFIACAIGANICYSFIYVLEFWFGSDDPNKPWNNHVRSVMFVLGTLLAMSLALIGGHNIASMEYHRLRLL